MFVQIYFRTLIWAITAAAVLGLLSMSVDGFADAYTMEDGPIEMASALAFLFAAIVSAIALRRGAGILAAGVGAFGLVAFLDEMSFGERHFGFTALEIQGVKIDAVHDLLMLSWVLVGSPKLYAAIVLVLTTLSVWVSIMLIRRSGRVRSLIANRASPLIAASLSLAVIAQFIYFQFGKFAIWQLFGGDGLTLLQQSRFEEALELVSALVLVAAARRMLLSDAPSVEGPDYRGAGNRRACAERGALPGNASLRRGPETR